VLNNAGDKSGVDFDYLVKTAQRESAMNPTAKAPSSSAVGLFQFLEQSWLAVMKTDGGRLGYQQYSDAITVTKDGTYTIKDKALLAKVLKLREIRRSPPTWPRPSPPTTAFTSRPSSAPHAQPRRTLHRAFPRSAGRREDVQRRSQGSRPVAAKLFPDPGQGQPRDLLRPGRPCPHRAGGLQGAGQAARRHRRRACARRADSKFAAQQMAAAPPPAAAAPPTNDKGWAIDDVPSRFTKADMSFTALFASDTPSGTPTPLIGAEPRRRCSPQRAPSR